MAAGLGILRLTPQAFWAMTPRELAAALGHAGGHVAPSSPPQRADLVRLMQSYPDQ